ncbi:MAG TPA: SDR family NAD(P)-dependent oxidoreductase [Methylomirabilota bacterium]|nr:SDR family NAD(P)-dependent oxidoreductase [Methylomirabilota bacterium]
MRLRGKTALVTGAGRGIGRAIALALAAEGAEIAALDIDGDAADRVRRDIDSIGVKAVALAADLRRGADVRKAVEVALGQLGQLDLLVNNAGWDKLEPFVESEEETWDKIISLNFKGVLHTCRAVVPHMIERGRGKVISIASDAGRVGSMGEAVYAGTKGAVIAFSKTLAREVARHGITVNVVCPGLTDTPLLSGMREASARNAKVLDAVTRAIPLGRIATPEDIAGAVVYLASPIADYVTGQTLSVSGGLTMC